MTSSKLEADDEELELAIIGDERVWLEAPEAIRSAARLTLRGGPYSTAEVAWERAEHWLSTLTLAFLRRSISVDFLTRRSFLQLADHVLESMQNALPAGWRAVNDHAGIHVYSEDEKPIAVRMEAHGTVGNDPAELVREFKRASVEVSPNAHAALAYDLLSAAATMPSADATLLTLVNAIEALIDQGQQSVGVLRTVDHLLQEVAASNLPRPERDALASRVRELKRESIRQAGLRLVRTLAPRTYNGMAPDRFFDFVYGLRSNLTHGTHPALAEVQNAISELTKLARDLVDLSLRNTA